MAISPNTLNYFQGTGYAKWTPSGGSQRDLGNVVSCTLTPGADKLEHKSRRTGSAKTDKTVFPNKTMEIELVLDEITSENLQLLFGSPDPTTNSDGTKTLYARGDQISGVLNWFGTNDVGNQFDIVFGSIDFGPSNSLALITENDFGQITLTGTCNAVENSDGTSDFFTLTETPAA